MVRRKIKIMRIENATSRQVTFSKRRGGLFKKAHDLSVLCDVEVGVIVFSCKGKLFQFASSSMQSVLERYAKSQGDSKSPNNNMLLDNSGSDRVTSFIDKAKSLQSHLIGSDLEGLSLRDVIHLEQQTSERLERLRSRKDELLFKELEDIKDKVIGARRTTDANIPENLVDSRPSEVPGSRNAAGRGDCDHCCAEEVPQIDASLPC